jgi:hypothetical protein
MIHRKTKPLSIRFFLLLSPLLICASQSLAAAPRASIEEAKKEREVVLYASMNLEPG